MTVRQPAVAGLFYPAGEDELRRLLATLLDDGRKMVVRADRGNPPVALIVPHAGYIYSGPVAAHAYRLLEPLRGQVERILLLGPAHHVWLRGMALPGSDAFMTPLGLVPVDREAVAAATRLPGVEVSDLPHALEHSLEVQLPFLQTVLARFDLVPLAVGECAPALVAGLIDALWDSRTLVVVSSDLSHYQPYDEARRMDHATCEQILARRFDLAEQQACGARAINGLLRARRCRSLDLELLDLRNSGDTGGDKTRVVGYAAIALH